MKVIRANVLGFCMGVRRAQKIALSEAESADSDKVFTLGPLVHNPIVLEGLKERGVETLAKISENLKGCKVIIRAHGISPEKELSLREKGAQIIDATCPKVKKSQSAAQKLSRSGHGIFLAGEKKHAEIEGILGFAKEAPFCIVAGNSREAEAAAKEIAANTKGFAKTALLGQTTISQEEYSEIAQSIKKHFPCLKIVDTICSATRERQNALRRLLDKTEAVIIAGGKESANTRRLFAIAKESGKPCCLVESAGEIPKEYFFYDAIGISAGASTPESVISEIEQVLLLKDKSHS